MKKFLKIRNLLILLIIVIAIVYIFMMRTRDTSNSKTSKLYYELVNKDVVTMTLEFQEDDFGAKIIYSTDNKNKKTIRVTEVYDSSEWAKNQNAAHNKSVAVNENGRTHSYFVNYDLKKYMDYGETKEGYDTNNWISEYINSPIGHSKYYTKNYGTVNSENLFIETFPKDETKYCYEGDNLKYIDTTDGTSQAKRRLYRVTIEYNFVEDSLVEIPSDFELVDTMEERRTYE